VATAFTRPKPVQEGPKTITCSLQRHTEEEYPLIPCVLNEGIATTAPLNNFSLLKVSIRGTIRDAAGGEREGTQVLFFRNRPSHRGQNVRGFSVAESILSGLRLASPMEAEVTLQGVDEHEAALSEATLVLYGHYLSKRDLWFMHREMMQRGSDLIYANYDKNYGLHIPHSKVEGMTLKNSKLALAGEALSGWVAEHTALHIKSGSANMFVLVHISRELFEYAMSGRVYWEILIDLFKEVLGRLQVKGSDSHGHYIQIVLIARAKSQEKCSDPHRLDQPDVCRDRSSPMPPQTEAAADEKKSPQDFFEVLWEGHARSLPPAEVLANEVRRIIVPIFCNYLRRWNSGVWNSGPLWAGGTNNGEEPQAAEGWRGMQAEDFMRAQDGPILESLNIVMDCLDRHHLDRMLKVTGQSIVLLTAGDGCINTEYKLQKLTHRRFTNSGPSSQQAFHMICIRKPPIHKVPWLMSETSLCPYQAKRVVAVDEDPAPPSPEWITVSHYPGEAMKPRDLQPICWGDCRWASSHAMAANPFGLICTAWEPWTYKNFAKVSEEELAESRAKFFKIVFGEDITAKTEEDLGPDTLDAQIDQGAGLHTPRKLAEVHHQALKQQGIQGSPQLRPAPTPVTSLSSSQSLPASTSGTALGTDRRKVKPVPNILHQTQPLDEHDEEELGRWAQGSETMGTFNVPRDMKSAEELMRSLPIQSRTAGDKGWSMVSEKLWRDLEAPLLRPYYQFWEAKREKTGDGGSRGVMSPASPRNRDYSGSGAKSPTSPQQRGGACSPAGAPSSSQAEINQLLGIAGEYTILPSRFRDQKRATSKEMKDENFLSMVDLVGCRLEARTSELIREQMLQGPELLPLEPGQGKYTIPKSCQVWESIAAYERFKSGQRLSTDRERILHVTKSGGIPKFEGTDYFARVQINGSPMGDLINITVPSDGGEEDCVWIERTNLDLPNLKEQPKMYPSYTVKAAGGLIEWKFRVEDDGIHVWCKDKTQLDKNRHLASELQHRYSCFVRRRMTGMESYMGRNADKIGLQLRDLFKADEPETPSSSSPSRAKEEAAGSSSGSKALADTSGEQPEPEMSAALSENAMGSTVSDCRSKNTFGATWSQVNRIFHLPMRPPWNTLDDVLAGNQNMPPALPYPVAPADEDHKSKVGDGWQLRSAIKQHLFVLVPTSPEQRSHQAYLEKVLQQRGEESLPTGEDIFEVCETEKLVVEEASDYRQECVEKFVKFRQDFHNLITGGREGPPVEGAPSFLSVKTAHGETFMVSRKHLTINIRDTLLGSATGIKSRDWFDIFFDSKYAPPKPFVICLQWLVCTSVHLTCFVEELEKIAIRHRFKLQMVPVGQIFPQPAPNKVWTACRETNFERLAFYSPRQIDLPQTLTDAEREKLNARLLRAWVKEPLRLVFLFSAAGTHFKLGAELQLDSTEISAEIKEIYERLQGWLLMDEDASVCVALRKECIYFTENRLAHVKGLERDRSKEMKWKFYDMWSKFQTQTSAIIADFDKA